VKVAEFVAAGAFLAFVTWGGVIAVVPDDRKPVVACAPVYYTAGAAHRLWVAGSQTRLDVAQDKEPRPVHDVATLACLKFADRFNRTPIDPVRLGEGGK
jgi:hypothetical protein